MGHKPEWMSCEEAVKCIKSEDKVYVHAVAATPGPLLEALCSRAKEDNLKNIKLYHLHLTGETPWATQEFEGIIRSCCLHVSKNMREAVNEGRADCMAVFLSELPLLFKRRIINLDVALIQCSIPDFQGYCSLGTNVDCTRAAIKNAKRIVGICNPQMPRTFGDGMIHESHFDALVFLDFPLPEFDFSRADLSEAEKKIGEQIAEHLVDDGATIQFGIGTLPQAIIPLLKDKKSLGVHTEQFGDAIIDLVESSVITNSLKAVYPGKVVGTFCVGTKRLYDYIHDNPQFVMCDCSLVNDQGVIRRNPKVTSVNSAVEVDITGQVVADSIGDRFISGTGGQMDFVRGATLCDDGKGKAVICMTSKAKNGASKIVPIIKQGGGVVTSRAHVNYVVTEYGIAQLFGKNFRQRAHALINIAHPDERETLEKESFDRFKVMPSAD